MKKTKPIRKAVIAAAGFGSRFLPQVKAMPKEMLPLVDKPVIQYVVEELVEAGIEDIIIVTGANKRSIEDHFDLPSQDLVENLKRGNKIDQLKEIEAIAGLANFVYIRQKGPYGNATPLLCAEHLVDNEPFIYTFADDFIAASPNRFTQLIETYKQQQCSVLAAIKATKDDDYTRYGMSGGTMLSETVMDTKVIVEKPGKAKAPSNVCVVSGYLFTPEIFNYLHVARGNKPDDVEVGYTDGLELMLKDNHRVVSKIIENGRYFDSGNKLEYLKTVVEFAAMNPNIGEEFRQFLKTFVKEI
ncbi:UTP--glucose-1-phosphate uridylyltransferase [Candidatus Saccharibacteria bacterium]|nr:UTP--glucose-1-phosphate uridylyltransferase [Candidatus Saccharibacteria bacterium]MCB9821109.1 UTP--glucose-1-phosphate uridylyltransferase [Candidatus Nomurabacteria bacterium]